MSRKNTRVNYNLDSGNVIALNDEEIKAILRAADELIATGGRTMLTKILKGSKDKKILEYGLDTCPAYGFYSSLTLQEIAQRVDWMIQSGYLQLEYSGRLPLLVFSPLGWDIEKDTMANELLELLKAAAENKNYQFVTELKDRNREMILLLLDKIKNTNNAALIPVLQAWGFIEYKKVRVAIQQVIRQLQ